jgi:hypothetical protein
MPGVPPGGALDATLSCTRDLPNEKGPVSPPGPITSSRTDQLTDFASTTSLSIDFRSDAISIWRGFRASGT